MAKRRWLGGCAWLHVRRCMAKKKKNFGTATKRVGTTDMIYGRGENQCLGWFEEGGARPIYRSS